MEELIILFFQFLFEVVLQILIELPFDWFVGSREYREPQDDKTTWWYIISLLLGGVIGGVSLTLFPQTFIHSESARLAYLIAAPLLAGYSSLRMSRTLASGTRPWINPRLHAWCAFWFALVLTIIRFTYAHRL